MGDLPEMDLSGAIIGAAIEVHKTLGPGLLEKVYQRAMVRELQDRGISFKAEHLLPVIYKGSPLDVDLRIDLLVEDRLVVELKSVSAIQSVHLAQTLTYMKLASISHGLLINFNVSQLREGLRRVIAP